MWYSDYRDVADFDAVSFFDQAPSTSASGNYLFYFGFLKSNMAHEKREPRLAVPSCHGRAANC